MWCILDLFNFYLITQRKYAFRHSVHYFCMDNLIKCQKNHTVWIQIMVNNTIYVLCILYSLFKGRSTFFIVQME